MKILIVCPYYFPYTSGMTVHVQRVAEGLAKRGYQVRILTHNHNHLPKNEKKNNIEIIRVPAFVKIGRGIFSPWMTKKFLEILGWADIVNIHAPFFECGLLAKLARNEKKKIVFTYHCDLIHTGLISPIIVNRLHRISVEEAARNSDAIIVNSRNYASKSFVKNFLQKTYEVPPPIDDSRFERVSFADFRKKHSIKKDDFVAGFLGRLTWEKGVENLVRAADLLKKKIPELKVLIGGEGVLVAGGRRESMMSRLKEIVEKAGLGKVVIFAGRIPDKDINKFYSALDVFILPSVNKLESFGMVQIESMLCGTPVIASNLSGVSEPIRKTGFGISVKPGSPDELAEAILKLRKSRKKYLPERKKILNHFSLEKTLDGYEEVFMRAYL